MKQICNRIQVFLKKKQLLSTGFQFCENHIVALITQKTSDFQTFF